MRVDERSSTLVESFISWDSPNGVMTLLIHLVLVLAFFKSTLKSHKTMISLHSVELCWTYCEKTWFQSTRVLGGRYSKQMRKGRVFVWVIFRVQSFLPCLYRRSILVCGKLNCMSFSTSLSFASNGIPFIMVVVEVSWGWIVLRVVEPPNRSPCYLFTISAAAAFVL